MSSPVSNNVPAALLDGVSSIEPTVPDTHMHEEAAYIAEALRINTALTALDLNNVSIGTAGAAALALELTNTHLTVLDLVPNQIGVIGARASTAQSSHTPLAARITDPLAFGG